MASYFNISKVISIYFVGRIVYYIRVKFFLEFFGGFFFEVCPARKQDKWFMILAQHNCPALFEIQRL